MATLSPAGRRLRAATSAAVAGLLLCLAAGAPASAYDWRNRPVEDRWEPSAEQLEQCARVDRDYNSLTYCKRKSDGRWIILDDALPSLIPGAYIIFTDHEGRFCVFAHAPYANNGRSRPPSTTVCRTADGSYVDSDSIP